TLSAPPTPTPKPTSAPSGQASPVPVAAVTASDSAGPYAQLMLTELLPDPAAPQTDAHDEFIELYNPNDQPVDIKGYIIKTGASLGTKHTLPSAVIAPGTYLAVTSAASHIALSNSGTSLALYDPAGHQLGDTVTYGSAKPGQAWAWSESGWTWTTTPTPGAANHITAVSGQTGSSTGSVKGSTASKVSSPTSTTSAAKSAATSAASTHSGNWLIWVLVGLTICYCLYEFRHDLRRYYHQLRGHSGRRREASPAPEGR
ncbi:MAG TPA: lamin tail domain-containing protein, partial [Candidatus Saccharimonas sp.]|nr:lamin tail domain-containing protein [Candidatus Saccharimonas sp.]